MNVFCVQFCELPSRSAHSLALMKQCEAIERSGKRVYFIYCRNVLHAKVSDDEIFKYYSIKYRFTLIGLPVFRRLITPVFTIQVLMYFLLRKINGIIYTRNIEIAGITSFLGLNTILELHGQYNKLTAYQRLKNWPFLRILKPKFIIRTIVMSDVLKEIIKEENVFKNILMLPNGASRPATDSVLNIPNPIYELEVGYTGNLTIVKGIDLIINLASALPGIRFHIVGGSDEDIEYWLQKVKDLNIKNVLFHGYVNNSEMSIYLNTFDVCLLTTSIHKQLPEMYERETIGNGSPLKLFNYMAHGKAIICSERPEFRHILNSDNAIFCHPNNLKEWIDALIYLKDHPAQRIKMGMSVALEFEQKYTWDKRAQHIFDLNLE